MRLAVWHGYLLAGTGSNVFARELARQWAGAGHDVTVFSQDPHPEEYDVGGAATVRPDVGGLLPTFVIDRYPGYRVVKVQDVPRAELDAWAEANAAAIREHGPFDLVSANHVVMGGPVAAAAGMPYTVIVHGSELEYSMRGNDELSAWGAEALSGARAVIVGSEHIRSALTQVVGPVDNVQAVPPGVDVDLWVPQPREQALADLVAEARRDPPNPGNANERLPDEGNADRLAEFLAGDDPTVVYFGKLIENKGVQVLIEALREVDARAVIVGFGPDRTTFEQQAEGMRVLFTGPFEHRHLVHLLAYADVAVVPSIFPEAFGMVAAEAAAAGCPPIVALHSGLAEVASGLEQDYPPGMGRLAGFTSGDSAELAGRINEILALPPEGRAALREAARRASVERWSWSSVAHRILAASIPE
jgi:glycosyltransferase involved in cell wall biosynthesis